jgi:hypothetical protein
VVYFEHNPRSFARYGYSFRNIFDTLEGFGFCVYIYKDGHLEKVTRNFVSYKGYENLLAFRNRDIEFVRKRLLEKGGNTFKTKLFCDIVVP